MSACIISLHPSAVIVSDITCVVCLRRLILPAPLETIGAWAGALASWAAQLHSGGQTSVMHLRLLDCIRNPICSRVSRRPCCPRPEFRPSVSVSVVIQIGQRVSRSRRGRESVSCVCVGGVRRYDRRRRVRGRGGVLGGRLSYGGLPAGVYGC